ncbi:MAG TPA: hypothetical protein VFN87_12460 [Solirubrobacteraceae bacterium]|nr:hypothetical protein [Solirubrobacteraceae bacterium]
MTESGHERPASPAAGLCDRCRHQQIVRTTRGSVFSLCRRSRDEPERFARYPPLPVLSCPGFQPMGGPGGLEHT